MASSRRKSRRPADPVQVQVVQAGRGEESRPASVTLSAHREITQSSFELRKGPIPDAEELLRYGDAHPDAPEIILREFQRQGGHRRLIERRELALQRRNLEAEIQSEQLGVVFGLLIALVGFGCGTWLVASGHGVEGTVIFGLDVAALVSAFILGRPRERPVQRE